MEQLSGLKEQLDADLQSLGRAYEAIRGARNRFQDSKGSLEQFKQLQPGHSIMVPLTSSLYVSGSIQNTEKVLVDVGTGYYIEQCVPRAQEFFTKRASQMADTMENIANNITQKQKQQNQVIDVMQQKSQQIASAQHQSGS